MASRSRAGDTESAPLPLVQEVVGLWVQMQARLQAHFAALAAEHSLSTMQAKVLMQLDTSSAVTMRALADRLQYDPSNLTGVIDHMEALGAIQRRPDPRDRRVKSLTLTAAGGEIRERFWHRLVNDAGPLGHLSVGQLEELRAILRAATAGPSWGETPR